MKCNILLCGVATVRDRSAVFRVNTEAFIQDITLFKGKQKGIGVGMKETPTSGKT